MDNGGASRVRSLVCCCGQDNRHHSSFTIVSTLKHPPANTLLKSYGSELHNAIAQLNRDKAISVSEINNFILKLPCTNQSVCNKPPPYFHIESKQTLKAIEIMLCSVRSQKTQMRFESF